MEKFETIAPETCCLCGSDGPLTGEHKLMRSALKDEFGDEPVVIGRFGQSDRYRPLQSLRSKRLHFGAGICAPCNNHRTQHADLIFRRVNTRINRALAQGLPTMDQVSDVERIAVAQHFAKLLTCHIAEEAPVRWRALADFALGMSSSILYDVAVELDPIMDEVRRSGDNYGYSAHGGLGYVWRQSTNSVSSFRSSRTFGRARYVFSFELSADEQASLGVEQPAFWSRCQKAVVEQAEDESLGPHLARLGFN